MKNIKKFTMYFCVSALIVVLLYDVYAISKGGTDASISLLIIRFSYKMPMFTFLAGFTCGHLFWRARSTEDTVKDRIDSH